MNQTGAGWPVAHHHETSKNTQIDMYNYRRAQGGNFLITTRPTRKQKDRHIQLEKSSVATSALLLDLHKEMYIHRKREVKLDRTREEQSGHFLITTRLTKRKIHA